MTFRTILAIAAFSACFAVSGAPSSVSSPLELKWQNLVPQERVPLKDPLAHLTQDQRFDFETVIWARSLTDEQKRLPENEQAVSDAEKYELQFKQSRIDIPQLMKKYAAFEQKLRARRKLVRNDLDGKPVRMAGYLLPLEFSGEGEKDFLLVPYVGACIHVPPPPPNQIVLVQLKKAFTPKDLYTPVWIEGQMRTKLSSRSLFLVDGSRDISIGYNIKDASLEIYTGR